MNSRLVIVVGVVLALWMAAGRWLFGIGGPLTWWYLPSIGLVYVVMSIWLGRRLRVTRSRGRRTGVGTKAMTYASWASAVAFGITVPDSVGGDLVSMMSLWVGTEVAAEMSIAICNPLGIMAFTFIGAAMFFVYADVRNPKPEPTDEELLAGAVYPDHLR